MIKHNRSEMVAVLGPNEALPYYIYKTQMITFVLHMKLQTVMELLIFVPISLHSYNADSKGF
jgi:hypothetical protein